jgi:hypothetical protein
VNQLVRFKVDEYVVKEKGKEYSVLVFPFVKYMWGYDNAPEDEGYLIDGDVKAFSLLKYALAILTEASDKIIYFPCKQDGIGRYYKNYNVILCTPKAQLRRSSWIAIRRKLTPARKKGKYVLQYDRKKLEDYCMKKIGREIRDSIWINYELCPEVERKMKREHLEEVLGENMFFVLGTDECYYNHYSIANELDRYHADYEYGQSTFMGWILTRRVIKDMLDEKEEALCGKISE